MHVLVESLFTRRDLHVGMECDRLDRGKNDEESTVLGTATYCGREMFFSVPASRESKAPEYKGKKVFRGLILLGGETAAEIFRSPRATCAPPQGKKSCLPRFP